MAFSGKKKPRKLNFKAAAQNAQNTNSIQRNEKQNQLCANRGLVMIQAIYWNSSLYDL